MIKYFVSFLVVHAIYGGTSKIGDPVSLQLPVDNRILSAVFISTTQDKESVIPTPDEIKLHNMINAARRDPASVGFPDIPPARPLEPNINLWKAARFHSKEMIDNNYFDHDSYDANGNMYETWYERLRRFGYIHEGHIGENIAGNPTVEGAFRSWLNSPGHRANIFNPNFSEHGIGIVEGGPYGKMFTHNFGYRSIQFDLSISANDISFNPPSPKIGDTVKITASIRNNGKTHAFPVAVKFFNGNPDQGGRLLDEDTVDAIIDASGTENAIIYWYTAGENVGTREIWVKVDPGNHFSETNENNNSAYKTIVFSGVEETIPDISLNVSLNGASISFNRWIELTYSLNFPANCLLRIYDLCGRLVTTLVNERKEPGVYKIQWDRTKNSIGRGIYFCTLICNSTVITKKIIILN